MLALAAVFAVLLVMVGVWGALAPDRLVAFASGWRTRQGQALAAGLRVVCGCVLLLAAPLSRWPLLFEVVGLLAVAAGLGVALMGLERFTLLLGWFTRRPPQLVRALCILVVILGLTLLVGALPSGGATGGGATDAQVPDASMSHGAQQIRAREAPRE